MTVRYSSSTKPTLGNQCRAVALRQQLPQHITGRQMTRLHVSAAALALAMIVLPGAADAKGCLKGAAIGGAAGHYAGHHGVAGAVVGCVIGRHEARKHERERAREQYREGSRRDY
jgi:hypothetical protein